MALTELVGTRTVSFVCMTRNETVMAKWRGPRTTRDPLLITASHRSNRTYWVALARTVGLRCTLCGCPIEWRKEYRRLPNGRENPRYLVIGHVTSRYTAKRMGWTEQQINSLSNTRPECKHCSNKTGAQLGRQVQHSNRNKDRVKVRGDLDDSRDW
jgi:hypothetical protein